MYSDNNTKNQNFNKVLNQIKNPHLIKNFKKREILKAKKYSENLAKISNFLNNLYLGPSTNKAINPLSLSNNVSSNFEKQVI